MEYVFQHAHDPIFMPDMAWLLVGSYYACYAAFYGLLLLLLRFLAVKKVSNIDDEDSRLAKAISKTQPSEYNLGSTMSKTRRQSMTTTRQKL